MLFEAGCDPAEMLDPVEEELDEIALPVERPRKAVLVLAVGLVGYVGRRALCFELPAQPVRVVGFVAEQDIVFGQSAQQIPGTQKVMGLAARQDELGRQATRISERVNVSRQSLSGAAHTVNWDALLTLAPS